jgi:glycosyltransferase involved in cell wall biosynthesis
MARPHGRREAHRGDWSRKLTSGPGVCWRDAAQPFDRRTGPDAFLSMDDRSYLIYAPTAWEGSRQLTHYLAEALAARHRVLYVDPPLSPLGPLRYGLSASTWPRLRAIARRRVRDAGPLRVFGPLALPPVRHPRMRTLSLPLLRPQIAHAVRSAGLERPIVLAAHWFPELTGVAKESLRVGVIMDHATAGAGLMGLDPVEVEAEKAALCRSTDMRLATSGALRELLAEQGFASELVPAGFPAALAGAFDRATEPPEYTGLARPLLGYTGSIDDRLDFELIAKLADRFGHGSLVFVGSVSPRLSPEGHAALRSRANIHLLGTRTQARLPAYIRHLDVALMPYRDCEFTRYQSPIKVWEYLYAGPPIVGVGSDALRGYPPPLVSYAENHDEALSMAERGLASPLAGREERRRFALANTWEHRARQLDELVDRRLSGSAGRLGGDRARSELGAPTPLPAR